jgi:hypothetical protein
VPSFANRNFGDASFCRRRIPASPVRVLGKPAIQLDLRSIASKDLSMHGSNPKSVPDGTAFVKAQQPASFWFLSVRASWLASTQFANTPQFPEHGLNGGGRLDNALLNLHTTLWGWPNGTTTYRGNGMPRQRKQLPIAPIATKEFDALLDSALVAWERHQGSLSNERDSGTQISEAEQQRIFMRDPEGYMLRLPPIVQRLLEVSFAVCCAKGAADDFDPEVFRVLAARGGRLRE